MNRFEIDRAMLRGMVEEDLQNAELFEINIRNAIADMSANLSSFDCNSYAEAIKYNQHWLRIYAERAASKLQLVGLHDPDHDSVELAELRRILGSIEP